MGATGSIYQYGFDRIRVRWGGMILLARRDRTVHCRWSRACPVQRRWRKEKEGGGERGRQACQTYYFQTPTDQNSLRGSRNIPSVALQIPCDVTNPQLGEHLRDLRHLSRIDPVPARATPSSARFIPVQEPPNDEKRDDREGE